MADLAWNNWLDDVQPWVAGAGEQLVKNAVRDAAIAFCSKSRCFLLESDPINVTANEPNYAWANATYPNVVPHEFWQVYYDGMELDPITREKLKLYFINWSTDSGQPFRFIRLLPPNIRLHPNPSASLAAGLVIHAFVKPAENATGIYDGIGNEYHRQIANGAKAKLLQMSKMPWYNPTLGADFHQRFSSDISEAALKSALGDADQGLEGEGEFF